MSFQVCVTVITEYTAFFSPLPVLRYDRRQKAEYMCVYVCVCIIKLQNNIYDHILLFKFKSNKSSVGSCQVNTKFNQKLISEKSANSECKGREKKLSSYVEWEKSVQSMILFKEEPYELQIVQMFRGSLLSQCRHHFNLYLFFFVRSMYLSSSISKSLNSFYILNTISFLISRLHVNEWMRLQILFWFTLRLRIYDTFRGKTSPILRISAK